jgi:hypothetical protein
MNSSVFLSNFETTGTTFTDGYSAALCGAPTTDAYTPPGLTLAINFSAVTADRIRHRIERRKIRNRSLIVSCDHLIRADSLRVIDLPLQNPRDHSRPACFRGEYCRTPDVSYSAYDQDRLARFDFRS